MRNLISGGSPIESISGAPYQLSLRYGDNHICGASLISSKRALTAASCRFNAAPLDTYSIRAGSLLIDEDNLNAKHSAISEFIAHPSYKDTKRNFFDIAVLLLENEFPLGPSINYIQLPTQNENVPIGKMATVAGWGSNRENGNYSKKLRVTEVKIHENKDCAQNINDQMICAGDIEGNHTICYGDEGAPLIHDGVQIGIATYVLNCNTPNFLAKYTRVSSFITWINSV